jgi:hypothetical protein
MASSSLSPLMMRGVRSSAVAASSLRFAALKHHAVSMQSRALSLKTAATRPAMASQLSNTWQSGSRRFQSDSTEPPKEPPKKKRGTLLSVALWTWRLTYLSAIAGVTYVGYGIYLTRHPSDQKPPDPSKKTLVVLGMLETCNFIAET